MFPGLKRDTADESYDPEIVDPLLVKLITVWPKLSYEARKDIYHMARKESWMRRGWYLTRKICPPDKKE